MEELLTYLEGIHKIPQDAQNALSQICSEIHVKKNEDVQPIGHTCQTIYFVKKGLLRIYYLKDEVDVTESFEPENSLVARADSLFDGTPSKKGIQTIEEATLIAIQSTKLFELYNQYPSIERLFRLIVERAYVDTVKRLESLQFYSAEERYRNLLEEDPEIIQRVPLKYIASYLGITQVSLSRIRAKI